MKGKLTATERKLLGQYRRGAWKSRGPSAQRTYTRLAQRQLKEQRINIRLSAETLQRLREDALAEGLAYQTLIASILHRYAHGRLCDERHLRRALKFVH